MLIATDAHVLTPCTLTPKYFLFEENILEFSFFFPFLLERKVGSLREPIDYAGLRQINFQLFISLVLQYALCINRIVLLPFSYSVCF